MGKHPFNIQFGGLPVGLHEFEFSVSGTFFKAFGHPEINEADLEVKALLTKQNNLLKVKVETTGTVDLDCDRCMKTFPYPIETTEELVIKHGNPEESNDEILVIPEGKDEFDLSQYLYEYLVVAIPARRVPCELDPDDYECDQLMLEKLEEMKTLPKENKKKDSPWDKLNKLKTE